MEFKVGDLVVVDNLNPDVEDNPGIVPNMEELLGAELEVVGKSDGWYHLRSDLGEYMYSPEWLRPSGKKPKKEKDLRTKKELNLKLRDMRRAARMQSRITTYCHYGLLLDVGSRYMVSSNWNDVCHARLKPYEKGEIAAVIDFAGKPKEKLGKMYPTFLRYADFIINRSYAREAFIPTNMSGYIRHGVMGNVEATATAVMTGMCALRMGKEKPNQMLPMFKLLTRKGYDEGVAFLFGISVSKRHGKYQVGVDSYHSTIDSSASLTKIIKVGAGTFVFPKGATYHSNTERWAVFASLRGGGISWGRWLVEEAGQISGFEDKGWGEKGAAPLTEKQLLLLVDKFQELVNKEKSV